MEKLIIFALIVIIFLFSNVTSVEAISKLHVDGRYIKNETNHTVILRGVNKAEFVDDPDGIWMGDTLWKDENVKAELDAMKNWGVNVIRAHISVELWKYDIGPNSGHPASPYCNISTREAIKRFLKFAAERDMYVILDPYSIRSYWTKGEQDPLPFPPYQTSPNASDIINSSDDFVDWWRSVARELKDYPNVIFELWNEPHTSTAFEEWLNVSQKSINAIRKEGADRPIIFQWQMGVYTNVYEDEQGNPFARWGEHLYNWLEKAVTNLTDPARNLIFSTHVYRLYGGLGIYIEEKTKQKYNSSWPYTYEHIKVAFEYMGFKWAIETLNVPLLVGEVGATMDWMPSNPIEHEHEMTAWKNVLTIFNEWGLHYQAFWWRDIGIFRLLEFNKPWIPPPTESGQILIDSINPSLTGKLIDKNNNPVQANITIYQTETDNIVNSNQTNSTGDYKIPVSPGIYDVEFNILLIPKFFIKLLSVNVFSKLQDVINYFTTFNSKISFVVNVKDNQTIQVYSDQKPRKVLLNSTPLTEVSTLSNLASGTWFYDSIEKKLHLIANKEGKALCPFDCCINEKSYFDKFCNSSYYCSYNSCVAKTECPFECCLNEEKYLDKSCPSGKCYNRSCSFFVDGFESGDFSAWTGYGGAPVISTQKHNGTYSMENNALGEYVYKTFAAVPDVYVRIYWMYNGSIPSGSRVMTTLLGAFADGTWRLAFYLYNDSGTLKWQSRTGKDFSFKKPSNQQTNPAPNTWHAIEVHMKSQSILNEALDGEYHFWVNGNELTDIAEIGVNTSSVSIQRLDIGWRDGSSIPDFKIWIDSVVVSEKYIEP